MNAGNSGMVAGYHLIGPIRTDALGQVFIADRPGPTGRVLMRLLAVDPNAPGFRSRFAAQAHAVQGLVHPGLGGLLQYGEESGRTWFTSRFVDGHLLTTDRRADAEALGIAGQVADVLDHAHRRGIVHGDLGPGEILLPGAAGPGTTGGSVVVLDVGTLALAGRPILNPLSGSPEYTAPEVIAGQPVGPASDQYSLACLLYQILTGTTPFAASSPTEVVSGHLHRQAPPISATRPDLTALDVAFGHALDKDPARRYPDCRAFVGTVATLASRAAAQHQPSAPETPPTSLRERAHSPAPGPSAPVVTAAPAAPPVSVPEQPTQAPVQQLPVPERAARHATVHPLSVPPTPDVAAPDVAAPDVAAADVDPTSGPVTPAPAPPTVVPLDTGSTPGGASTPPASPATGPSQGDLSPSIPMPNPSVGQTIPSGMGVAADPPPPHSPDDRLAPPPTGSATPGSPDTLPPMELPADPSASGRGTRVRRRVLASALALAAAAVIAVVAVAATWFVVGRGPTLTQVTATPLSNAHNTSCAIRNGQAYCWGSNSDGALGNGTTVDSTTPVQVGTLSKVTSISVGWTSACAIADGTLYCWGNNAAGQLGDGTTDNRLTPTKVAALHHVTSVSVGSDVTLSGDNVSSDSTTCAVADGGAYCWGANTYGQLGDGTTDNRTTPTRVQGVDGAVSLTTDSGQTCALTDGGAVYCWGSNSRGQLGDGTTNDRHTPTRIGGLSDITDVATSVGTTCAVGDGNLYCWGNDTFGQTGGGDRLTSRTPTQVPGLTDVTSVSLGTQTTCAVAGGAAYCWGNNSSNGAGYDPRGYFSTPMKISGLNGTVTAVTTDSVASCAQVSDKVYCWGDNSRGDLGIGSTDPVSAPVEVAF
ncbi:serine/threonine protein kinase [Gordonia sp. N1V]|uniref:protein kinase domain-containing protein n=1 Tax=Gordonia sp. N1V TaxID=3034163 RepID=UPI0023E1A28C|nr:serine/threonine protein kinase [Gordonia sp. N1V]MDF3280326.1 serine/threonine protein kinase [Gordonia sp. N1V]